MCYFILFYLTSISAENSKINGNLLLGKERILVIENRNDIACPVALFFRYREICEPKQEFVFCRQSSIAVKLERMRKNQPYLIDPTQRLGEKSVSLYCRILSHHIGVKDWEKVKNHRI